MRKNITAVLLFVTIFILHQQNARAQWVQTSLKNDFVFAISENDSDKYIYAGTDKNPIDGNGGVYRSTDDGANWIPVNNGLCYTNIQTFIVVDSTIFVGSYKHGIFRSTNNGANWLPTDSGLDLGYGVVYNEAILTLIAKGGIILAGTNYYPTDQSFYGMYRSTNNGQSWLQIFSDSLNGIKVINAFAMNDSDIFAGTDNGVRRSTDNGITWNIANNGLKILNISS